MDTLVVSYIKGEGKKMGRGGKSNYEKGLSVCVCVCIQKNCDSESSFPFISPS